MTNQLLTGSTAVVTGAARGIGQAIAARLGQHGASVVVVDRDADGVERAAAGLGALDIPCLGLTADVTSMASMRDVLHRAVEFGGRLDIMVNNAGINRDNVIWRMDEEDFDVVVGVNLKGVWIGTKVAIETMRSQAPARGVVVNISSIAGKAGNFGQSNYSAAKAGVVGLTKAAAKEAARSGIRVNAVQPGLITSPMTEALPAAALQEKLGQIPLGRPGEAAEVADAVVFLASPMSSYVTGAVLEVTGGRLM